VETVETEDAVKGLRAILEENEALRKRVRELEEENGILNEVLDQVARLVASCPLRDAEPKPDAPHEIFSRPLKSLELSVRSDNCLSFAGVETIGKLVTLTEAGTPAQKGLLGIRSFGRTSLREVKRKLDNLGLHLGMTEEEIAKWTPPANLT
jgi:DNA-directed RNA polymerase subunit alpha